MGELIFLALLMLLGAAFFGMSFEFKTSALDTSGGAAFWPRIVIGFLAIFLIIRAVEVFREKEKRGFVFVELFQGPRLFFLLSLVGYIALFQYLGYIVSTTLFLLITVNIFYKITRDNFGTVWSILIRNAVAVIFSMAFYYFFAKVIHIMLPTGTVWRLFAK